MEPVVDSFCSSDCMWLAAAVVLQGLYLVACERLVHEIVETRMQSGTDSRLSVLCPFFQGQQYSNLPTLFQCTIIDIQEPGEEGMVIGISSEFIDLWLIIRNTINELRHQ